MATRECATILVLISVITVIGLDVHSSSQDQSELIKQLASDDMKQRMEAFYKIRSGGIAPENKELMNALLDLLEKENQLIDTTLRESNGRVGASGKYGEEYLEYVGWLGDVIFSKADLTDKRILSILLRSSYHPTARFAVKLLEYGDAAVPTLIELANSDITIRRVDAVEMLGLLISKHRVKISDQTADLIKQTLSQRLDDSDMLVKRLASKYLTKINN